MASPLAAPEPWDLVSAAYVDEIVPHFTRFADDALRLADLPSGARVIDVAAGPGTLSFAAARQGMAARAIDFSPAMIAALSERAQREGLAIDATVADGQSLPFPDGSFDAGFSLFGLMFFPDRGAGFRELRRVLSPGAPAVVTSWVPLDRVPFLGKLFATLGTLAPPAAPAPFPLTDAAAFTSEMTAAGFRGVAVIEVTHTIVFPSLDAALASMLRSTAPFLLLRRRAGEGAWARATLEARRALVAMAGEGPQAIPMTALMGFGRA